MKLNHSEFVILQWLGGANSRIFRPTSKLPLGWNERVFYSLIDLGLVVYNPRTAKAYLTEHGRRFYKKYIEPVVERRKQEIRDTFASFTQSYAPEPDDVQTDLERTSDNAKVQENG